jgi:hypothetical protein
MRRFLALFLALIALAWAPGAYAQVTISFQSFDGSSVFGRFPHAFIVLEGTEDATGKPVSANYGFTAKHLTPAILTGPVQHEVMVEKSKYITRTNRHFTVRLTDAQYHRIEEEVAAWRNQPGKYYDLNSRNCIHFVGRMAELSGLAVEYPRAMLRKPKAWLNHIAAMNPQLRARPL